MKKHLLLILFSFFIAPLLTQAQNPTLWGMTADRGANNEGIIFSYDLTSGKETDIHDFGSGTDLGVPYGSLIQAKNGLFYGMTGAIFSYDFTAGKETVLHIFGNGKDGRDPYGSLVQANNGLLYGMTFDGGAYGCGIIFSYNIFTNTETDIHDFNFSNRNDGCAPDGSLIQASNGLLYGMTQGGGVNYYGTIFSYDISADSYTDIHDFDSTFSNTPTGSLVQARNGLLYGMTSGAATASPGTIFSYDISTHLFSDLYVFGNNAADGEYPQGSLFQASNDLLYGLTLLGGSKNRGTIISYNISTDTETDVHDFGIGTDGQQPNGSLIQGSNGLLYGMTYEGGINDEGTIFSYNISSGTGTDIYDFGSDTDGAFPYGDLIEVDPSIATGINQFATTPDVIQLYPNPASDFINLKLIFQQEQPANLTLYNTLGQEVWEKYLGNTKEVTRTIPLSNFVNGVYILQVNTGSTSLQREVIIAR